MDNLTSAAEAGALGNLLGTEYTITPPIVVGLVTALGTDAVPGTEVTGGGYSRKTLVPGTVSAGHVENSSTVTFTGMPACTVIGLEVWDSTGIRIWHGPLNYPVTLVSGESLQFPAGSIQIEMGGTLSTRTITTMTQTIDGLAEWRGTVNLGKAFKIIRIETTAPCRVRVYSTVSARLADEPRPIGTLPSGDHGLILEYVSDSLHLSADLDPHADGASLEETPTSDVPMCIKNLANSTADISVELTYLKWEW